MYSTFFYPNVIAAPNSYNGVIRVTQIQTTYDNKLFIRDVDSIEKGF
ncbi:MAG: hypothetical protein P8X73_12580 [Ignavibacteriaceae bacterium]